MNLSFENKVALVTGASSGMGLATAQAFASDELSKIETAEELEVDETDSPINDQIDAPYRGKYGRYPQYVAPMVAAEVRSTTLKLVPRLTSA